MELHVLRINPAFAQLLLRHQTDTRAKTGKSIDVQLIDIMRFAEDGLVREHDESSTR